MKRHKYGYMQQHGWIAMNPANWKGQTQRIHTVRFHLCDILEKAKLWGQALAWGLPGTREGCRRDCEGTHVFAVTKLFYILVMVAFTWLYLSKLTELPTKGWILLCLNDNLFLKSSKWKPKNKAKLKTPQFLQAREKPFKQDLYFIF